MDAPSALATPVPAALIHAEIRRLGVTHVPLVPDKHQQTLIAALSSDSDLRVLPMSTEDEAIAVNAGLWIGGAEPLVLIQNVGVLAAVNALRGVALEQKVPTCMLVGEFGREVQKPVDANASSAVRVLGPLLAALQIPCYRLDSPACVGTLAAAFAESRRERRAVAVIVGAPTM